VILDALKQFHTDFKARISRHIRTQEIVKVLSATHMQELSKTPGNEWAMVKSKHAEEIQAVRDGKFDIVDRRSWAWPYLPEALHRLNQPILKNTPYNLRRFSETPIPRRAINLIKNAILDLKWEVEVVPEMKDEGSEAERAKRIRIATECFRRPNNVDSYRTLWEAVAEDIIAGGYGCIEPRMTPSYKRPFKMWAVDGSTIRLYADWTESTPDRPRFAQMTGLKGERGIVGFLADELVYIKDNNRSNTPFGLGKLEVAFNTINAFLGVQDMASKAGSDQVHKSFLWWEQPQNQAHVQTVRRHIQNELEGQSKISLLAGLKKPEVIDIKAVLPDDLLLDWQEFLIRIIANAFDLSPFSLGLEKDVNRNTGLIMSLSDFRGAVVPMASRIEESITRDILHGFLGWKDLQFRYKGLSDPDPLTKVQIQQREYQMNAITPDEMRKEQGRPDLPNGWGKINFGQMQILIAEAMAIVKAKFAGAGAGGGAASGGGSPAQLMPGAGSYTGGGPGNSAGGSTPGSAGGMRLLGAGEFSNDDVKGMTPEEVQYYQEMGLLPPGGELMQQMDTNQPGILEQLSEELLQFLEQQEESEEEDRQTPQKVTAKDEKEQLVKYKKSINTPTLMEQYLNDRYRFGTDQKHNATMQPGARGKYPRSGGVKGNYK
jgi:hypothetical protein